jgi:RNA polymerase sigma-70 factor, ECF subfamily
MLSARSFLTGNSAELRLPPVQKCGSRASAALSLPVMVASAPPATRSGAGPSDAALVLAARAGEGWAQEALFHRHARMAFGLAHRFLPRDLDVDDLVQDSFLYALQHLEKLQNPQAFAAWLGTIVVRTASKRFRRQRLLTRLGLRRAEPIDVDGVISSEAEPDAVAELRALFAFIERFPAEERVAITLRRVDGLGVTQIAEYMESSESTVKRRLRSAEERLERYSKGEAK